MTKDLEPAFVVANRMVDAIRKVDLVEQGEAADYAVAREFLEARDAAVREAALEPYRWVPVEERLPELAVPVVAWGTDEWSERPRMMFAWRVDDDGRWCTGVYEGMCDDEVRLRVSHWQPMPDPPTPSSKGGSGDG